MITSISLVQMSAFNLNIDFRTAVFARCVQGLGLAFLFVPLNTLAFSYIAKSKINNATGLINLARNLGGSCGIAGIMTLLSRRIQFHRGRLVEHLTPFDTAYREAMAGIQHMFSAIRPRQSRARATRHMACSAAW